MRIIRPAPACWNSIAGKVFQLVYNFGRVGKLVLRTWQTVLCVAGERVRHAWETASVRQHSIPCSWLLIGVFAVVALLATWGAAQYGPGGYENGPPAQGGPGSINQPVVPRPPAQPPATSRPPSWPGGPTGEPPPQTPAGDLPPGQMEACNGARIVAYVGSEVILEGDLILRKMDEKGTFEIIGSVDHVVNQYQGQYSPDQLVAEREKLIAKLLPEVVEIKLIYLDAKQTIPSEHWPDVEKQLTGSYEEMQLKKTMKQFGVATPGELDQKLRAVGTSVEREKRAFIEFVLARQWQREQIKHDDEITLDQMRTYYYQHQDEFTRPLRAKWEELLVRFSKYSSEEAAGEAIARMGNRVRAGVPFADVARASSDGVEAAKGGRHDWTAKGSLVPELDQALFGLPIGQLSPIIKSPVGWHIIRVTEREEATVTSFLDAQVAINDKIRQDRSMKQIREYLAKVKARTPVKTIFDGPPQVANRPGQPEQPQPELRR